MKRRKWQPDEKLAKVIVGLVVIGLVGMPAYAVMTKTVVEEEKAEKQYYNSLQYTLQLDFFKLAPESRKSDVVSTVMKILRERLEKAGVSNPDIKKRGPSSIQVKVDTILSPESVTKLLTKNYLLEFKLVASSKEKLEQALKGNIPEGYELAYYERKDSEDKEPLLLEKDVLLNNQMIREAAIGVRDSERVFIRITLTPRGKALFAEVTGKNVGRRLAVVLDGKVLTAPRIYEKIAGGEGQIPVRLTPQEARDVAAIIQNDNLPVPVHIVGKKEKKLLGTVRTSAAGLYNEADMLYRKMEDRDAIRGFEKLLQQYPENEKVLEALFSMAWCYVRLGNFVKAMEVYKNIVSNYPQHEKYPAAVRLLGIMYYRQGQYQMCLETLQELISQFPEQEESDEAQRTIYVCYVAMERYDNALSWAKEIVESYEERELPPWFGGSFLFLAKCVIDLVDNNGDYSGKPLALFWKAESYALRKQPEEAEETYREILTKYPNSKIVDNVQIRVISLKMARVHRKRWKRKELTDEERKELKKEYLKVAEEFKGIIEKYPEGDAAPTGYFSLVGIYEMIGEPQEASNAYNAIIQKFPESPWADAARESLGKIRQRICVSNLQQIGLALWRYARDHNKKLPDDLKKLYPDYVDNPVIFWCPGDKDPKPTTITNSILNNENSAQISYRYCPGYSVDSPHPSMTIILEDNSPDNHAGKKKNVLFLDLHVEAPPIR
jgi:prepilin-type processing-associated H-X9-DG protein